MGIKCPKCHSDNPDDLSFCGKCGTPLKSADGISVTKTLITPEESLQKGSTIAGRYEIIEELGKGGMGRVYKVNDIEIKERVALKLLKPEIASDESTIERFRNELKIARKVSHKHVCRMHDIGKEEDKYFITMEYVEGEDLKSYIRKKERVSTEDAIGITKQVCEGLAEAHELGVIHRDMKPQNIMIDDKGKAKIMDFGIARSVEAPGVTATGVIIGTPDYISPEQAEGEEADQRSDIYSLGVILYEMITGGVPFKGDTAFSVALKHKTQLPQDPRKLNPEISDDLGRLILICMEKDRERRYQTATELLEDLQNIEEGFPLGTKIKPRRETIVSSLIRKKFFIPALVVILAIIAVVIWQVLPQKEASSIPSDKNSVAVLPFVDLSQEKSHEYLCDGISDTLINALSSIKDLRVPARTSAFLFKGKELDIPEISRKLEVENVLEGSVQVVGNRLRVNVRLIRVEDLLPLWSNQYDLELDDVFAIQDEISLAVVDNLKVKLLGEEEVRLVKRHTDNLEAYNLYLRGLYSWNMSTEEGWTKGMEYFQQAIEADPTYALAYVGLANSLSSFGFWCILDPKDAFPQARAFAEKALEIDDTLAEAHCALANISFLYDWNWSAAEEGFKKAIELNPGYAKVHDSYGTYLGAMGRHDESLIVMRRALELDPLFLSRHSGVGWVFFNQRLYDLAIEQFQKTLEMDPDFSFANFNIGRAYVMKGMYEEAIQAFEKASRAGFIWADGYFGYIYALSGERDKAEELLNELEERSKMGYYVPASSRIVIYVGLGEIDKAFEWKERAFEERDTGMVLMKILPFEDGIRSDPRFKAMLKKLNLE